MRQGEYISYKQTLFGNMPWRQSSGGSWGTLRPSLFLGARFNLFVYRICMCLLCEWHTSMPCVHVEMRTALGIGPRLSFEMGSLNCHSAHIRLAGLQSSQDSLTPPLGSLQERRVYRCAPPCQPSLASVTLTQVLTLVQQVFYTLSPLQSP